MGIRAELLNKEKLINERRSIFNKSGKKLLADTFSKYLREQELEDLFFIDAADKLHNFQSIYLSEISRSSGIKTNEKSIFFNKNEEEPVNIIYKGGALIFSQKYDGHLVVIYTPPFVKDIAESKELLILEDNIDPLELNEAIIIPFIETFMQNIVEWGVQTPEVEEEFKLGFVIPEHRHKH